MEGWSESLQPSFLLTQYYERIEVTSGYGAGMHLFDSCFGVYVFKGIWHQFV
jgi:hypothetical protein